MFVPGRDADGACRPSRTPIRQTARKNKGSKQADAIRPAADERPATHNGRAPGVMGGPTRTVWWNESINAPSAPGDMRSSWTKAGCCGETGNRIPEALKPLSRPSVCYDGRLRWAGLGGSDG